MSLSGAQVAQLLYQAGFRGETLVQMAAIAKRESGWKPEAHRTTADPNGSVGDFGLLQINYVNVPTLVKAGIISTARDLLDPVKNVQAAWFLSGGGTNLKPWAAVAGVGWSAGGNPLAGVSLGAGRQAVQDAQTLGLLGKNYDGTVSNTTDPVAAPGANQGGGTQPSYPQQPLPTSSGSSFATGQPAFGGGGSTAAALNSAAPTPSFSMPGDASYVQDQNGTVFALFDIGGAKVAYDISDYSQIGGVPASGVQFISADQWAQQNIIHGGNVSEVGNVSQQFGSFGAYWDALTTMIFGANNPARNDPSVKAVLAMFAGRPDMTQDELKNRLSQTTWYQTHTQDQLSWNGLSDAEKQSRRDTTEAQMADQYMQFMGQPGSADNATIANYLEKVVSGEMSMATWTEKVLKPAALDNAGSTYSQQVKQPAINIENTALKVRQQLTQWGLQWDEGTIQSWARNIVNKDSSDDDLMEALKQQAQVLYPWKDRETDTQSAAAPWVQTYGRVMEKSGSLQTPEVQQALQGAGTPVWQFEQNLKKSSGWLETKNARDTMSTLVSNIGSKLGFT